MKLQKLISRLELIFPLKWQEDYDNSGLQIGNLNKNIKKILCCLDCSQEVINEAIKGKYDLILSHHPLIFSPLFSINLDKNNFIERLIKNDIAVYSIHTNLDNAPYGINRYIGELLELNSIKVLKAEKIKLCKVITYVPKDQCNQIRKELSNAGAGNIDEYSSCSFKSYGIGTFFSSKNSKPFVGEIEKLNFVEEEKLEMIFPEHIKTKIVNSLLKNHPYETPAYDIIKLDLYHPLIGAGIFGHWEKPKTLDNLLDLIKKTLRLNVIKYSGDKKLFKSIAFVSGSGSDYIDKAKSLNIDGIITADIKYHQFQLNKFNISIFDIGHYESEIMVGEILKNTLKNIDIKLISSISKYEKNYIKYY